MSSRGRVGRRIIEHRDTVELGVGEDVGDLRLQRRTFDVAGWCGRRPNRCRWRSAPRARERAAACWTTSPSAPSAVCASEMPSLALRIAWLMPRICAVIELAMARPAASSRAELMRLPEDRRSIAVRRARFGDPAAILRAESRAIGVDNGHFRFLSAHSRLPGVDPKRATKGINGVPAGGFNRAIVKASVFRRRAPSSSRRTFALVLSAPLQRRGWHGACFTCPDPRGN